MQWRIEAVFPCHLLQTDGKKQPQRDDAEDLAFLPHICVSAGPLLLLRSFDTGFGA